MRVLRASLVALLALLATPAWAGSPKLGVVDVQKVMEAAPGWNEAVAKLGRELEQKRAKFEAEQAQLQEKKKAIDAKRMVSDPRAIAQEEGALLEAAQRFQQSFMAAQQELSQKETKLKEQILERVERSVFTIAKEQGFTYIFEKGAPQQPNVLWAEPSLDVTDQVIRRYAAQFGDRPFEAP